MSQLLNLAKEILKYIIIKGPVLAPTNRNANWDEAPPVGP